MKIKPCILMILIALLPSCRMGANKNQAPAVQPAANFTYNGDSAYAFTKKQVLFGPRVPNTKAHDECRKWLVEKMRQFGATITEQQARLTAFDGTSLRATNIIASYQPEKKERVLLCAHWDSRPWSDQETDPKEQLKPVSGANDGASGVGVLLEIARQLQLEVSKGNYPSVGVDLVLFDAEDYGKPDFIDAKPNGNDWCLGSIYWSKEAKRTQYKALYGILLDMVGGTSPTFQWDYYSMKYAPGVLRNVWDAAAELGYQGAFRPAEGGALTDDHQYVNELAGIPCIDIIDYDHNRPNGFVPQWHTQNDTMDYIDVHSLQMVGETLLHVLFNR